MGRQAQLEILKGAVKRTLLRRFHNCTPIFSNFRIENFSAGASKIEAACALPLSEAPLNPNNPASVSSITNLAIRNPHLDRFSKQEFSVQSKVFPDRPSDGRLLAALEITNPTPIIDECAASRTGSYSEPTSNSKTALIQKPTQYPPPIRTSFHSPADYLSTSGGPITVDALIAKLSFPSHLSGCVGNLLSRGFGSLAPSVNNIAEKEQGETFKGPERRVGKRGQQGKDQGGLGASASGVEEVEAGKKRRKKGSSIQDVEVESAGAEKRRAAAAVTAAHTGPTTSSELEGKLVIETEAAPTENEVRKTVQTQKKRRSTASKIVQRALSEGNESTPEHINEESMASTGGQGGGFRATPEDKPLSLSSSSSDSQVLAERSHNMCTSRNENVVGSEGFMRVGDRVYGQTGSVNIEKETKATIPPALFTTDQFTDEQLVQREDLTSSAAVATRDFTTGKNIGMDAIQSRGGYPTNGNEVHSGSVARAAESPSAKDTTNGIANSPGTKVSSQDDGGEFSNPKALFEALLDSKGGRSLQATEKVNLNSLFYRFAVSGWVSDQALSLYINSKFFPSAVSRFRRFFTHKSSPSLRSFLLSKGSTDETLQLLFPLFAEFCVHHFPDEIKRYRELVYTADMTRPDGWYPFARAIKRKVVYHKGPTNSGKTYNALQRFMASSRGIYCSPLRLLAMEVFDTVNMQGVYCNLHTGQEKREVPFANHLSCTIEMCYLNQQWDVAVIDEIQMMSDEYRGWAWTRAFLGLQADEIHVCGDPSALQLIRNLCSQTGDDLVEHEYERFKPLQVAEEALRGDFRNVEEGDCIVAFSRRDIFDIKREVELMSKHRCCVVYGALPPETRTHQAKLFNEPGNGYNVLVASDAIGMGLNLNIRRVVFFSLDKFDGASKKPVPPAQVKQIAGRAGRRGSLYPQGVTTTFFSQDLNYLKSSMLKDFEPATAAGLFPVFEQVELFASQLPKENFAKLLERFSETCRLDGAFFLSRYDNLKRVANMLEKVKGLSLEDRFNFCFAPVNVRDPQSMSTLLDYATAFSQKIPVQVEMGVPSSSARDEFELLDLESRHQALSMYLWLSQHFPGELFPQREQAGEMAAQIATLLGQTLAQSSRRWSRRKFTDHYNRSRPFPNTRGSESGREASWKGQDLNLVKKLVRA